MAHFDLVLLLPEALNLPQFPHFQDRRTFGVVFPHQDEYILSAVEHERQTSLSIFSFRQRNTGGRYTALVCFIIQKCQKGICAVPMLA